MLVRLAPRNASAAAAAATSGVLSRSRCGASRGRVCSSEPPAHAACRPRSFASCAGVVRMPRRPALSSRAPPPAPDDGGEDGVQPVAPAGPDRHVPPLPTSSSDRKVSPTTPWFLEEEVILPSDADDAGAGAVGDTASAAAAAAPSRQPPASINPPMGGTSSVASPEGAPPRAKPSPARPSHITLLPSPSVPSDTDPAASTAATSSIPPSLARLPELLRSRHSDVLASDLTVIHASELDRDAWVAWIVVCEVATGRVEDVASVAMSVGKWLKHAQPPDAEAKAKLDELLGPGLPVRAAPRRSSQARPAPAAAGGYGGEDEAAEQRAGGWRPRKILSREAIEGIRLLHAADPATHSAASLSARFKVSYEAVRRILKSRWTPSTDEAERQNRRAREREREFRRRLTRSDVEEEEERRLVEGDATAAEAERPRRGATVDDAEGGEDGQEEEGSEGMPVYSRVEYEGLILPSEALSRKLRDASLRRASKSSSSSSSSSRGGATRTSAPAASRGEGEWCLVKADWCNVHVMTTRARRTWDVETRWRRAAAAVQAAAAAAAAEVTVDEEAGDPNTASDGRRGDHQAHRGDGDDAEQSGGFQSGGQREGATAGRAGTSDGEGELDAQLRRSGGTLF